MTKDEALRIALEALERACNTAMIYSLKARIPECGEFAGIAQDLDFCITTLREIQAQPEQEPLEYWNAVEGWVKIDEVREHFESVSCGTIYKNSGDGRVPLYTTPPQRKPLTDEEIYKVFPAIATYHEANKTLYRSIARAIEAAHGIKE